MVNPKRNRRRIRRAQSVLVQQFLDERITHPIQAMLPRLALTLSELQGRVNRTPHDEALRGCVLELQEVRRRLADVQSGLQALIDTAQGMGDKAGAR